MADTDRAKRRAIVIAGPTASGKSAVALTLAERLGGVVLNADSMQVYADLAILTARPTPDDMARAPHRLFGHVDAAEAYSVGRWLSEVDAVLRGAWANGQVPVLVGGTGLYLKALLQGLSDIPAVPEGVRARIRRDAETMPAERLHDRLAAIDPAMAARLRPSDPQRIIRALEVFEATGRSLAWFQQHRNPPLLRPECVVGIVLAPERRVLNAAIDDRFEAMMAAGALDEVEHFGRRNLDATLPAMRALGVPPLLDHLADRMTLDQAVERGKSLTRHYAKRQLTFMRHQLPDIPWVSPEQAVDSTWAAWRSMASSLQLGDGRV